MLCLGASGSQCPQCVETVTRAQTKVAGAVQAAKLRGKRGVA